MERNIALLKRAKFRYYHLTVLSRHGNTNNVIKSFRCLETKRIFEGEPSRAFPPAIQGVARRKLFSLHAAIRISDLLSPRGNHLERLKGKRAGQYSIRVNDQYRLCFSWIGNDAYQVEITDYH